MSITSTYGTGQVAKKKKPKVITPNIPSDKFGGGKSGGKGAGISTEPAKKEISKSPRIKFVNPIKAGPQNVEVGGKSMTPEEYKAYMIAQGKREGTLGGATFTPNVLEVIKQEKIRKGIIPEETPPEQISPPPTPVPPNPEEIPQVQQTGVNRFISGQAQTEFAQKAAEAYQTGTQAEKLYYGGVQVLTAGALVAAGIAAGGALMGTGGIMDEAYAAYTKSIGWKFPQAALKAGTTAPEGVLLKLAATKLGKSVLGTLAVGGYFGGKALLRSYLGDASNILSKSVARINKINAEVADGIRDYADARLEIELMMGNIYSAESSVKWLTKTPLGLAVGARDTATAFEYAKRDFAIQMQILDAARQSAIIAKQAQQQLNRQLMTTGRIYSEAEQARLQNNPYTL